MQFLKKFWQHLILLSLVFFGLFFVLFVVKRYVAFDSDFAWQLSEASEILQGKFRLIGPACSLGCHFGPYYYYQLALSMLISGMSPNAITKINSILTLIPYFVASIIILRSRLRFSQKLLFAIIPFIFSFAQMFAFPTNANSYLGLVLLLFALSQSKISRNKSLIIGILGGIVLNYHFVALPVVVFCLIIYIRHQYKDNFLQHLSLIFLGIIITYLPLLIFEIRHDFVNTKTILMGSGLSSFATNSNLSYYIPQKNFVSGLLYVNSLFEFYLGFSFLFLLIFFSKKQKLYFFYFLTCIIGAAYLTTMQFAPHYFYPIAILSVLIICNSNFAPKKQNILIFLIILLSFINTYNKIQTLKLAPINDPLEIISTEISKKIIDKKTPRNVVYFTKDKISQREGNVLRYYLNSMGVSIAPRGEYLTPNEVIVVDETSIDPLKDTSYEMQSFRGNKELEIISKWRHLETDIYILKK